MNALAVQPDGKILMNSTCQEYSEECPSLVRLLADGRVDPGFQAPKISGFDQGIETFAFQPDGKILVGGLILVAGGLPYGGIVRLHPDGQLDSSFHPVPITVGDDIGCGVEHILVLPGGKILIAGGFTWDTGNDAPAALALLHADGTLDSNFLANIPAFEFVGSVALQADGKLLVSGTLMGADGARWEDFVRLNADGTEDSSFQPEVPGEVGSLVVQADGRILAISSSVPNGIVRLHPDGSLDPTFQTPAGLVTEAYWNAANRLILQPDGRVLVGGVFHSASGIPMHGIVRLNNEVVPSFVRRVIGGEMIQLMAEPPANVTVYAVEDRPPSGWQLMSISHGGTFDPLTGKVKFGPFFDAEPRGFSYLAFPPPGTQGVFPFTGIASADGVNTTIAGDEFRVIVGCHPAEARGNRPADWRMTIDEVTAYSAAWRRGESWPMPPVPIPIGYVTRAGFLWRGGECYQVDSSVTDAPLWWVSCATPAALLSRAATIATPAVSIAESALPPVFIPGEPITVRVAISPTGDAQSYAVEDQPPAGWTVSAITEGGEWDAANSKVKWGPFLDVQPRTLSYQAVPPDGVSGVVVFAGAASFDGASVPVAGSRQLRAGSRLHVEIKPATGRLLLNLTGPAGNRYLIQTSTDLVLWLPLAEITPSSGGTAIPLNSSPAGPQQFYRARLIE
jgi:uncharacterized delta-60 repeat protein